MEAADVSSEVHVNMVPGKQSSSIRDGVYYHVVEERRKRAVGLSSRQRIVASGLAAGLLVAVTIVVGSGQQEGGNVAVALESLQPEAVLVTVPDGARAGRLFDFDVPGRGEFSALVSAGEKPGEQVELEVVGQGVPLRSQAQQALQEAVRDTREGFHGFKKHMMFKAVVPRSAMLDGRFRVEVPGHGVVLVSVPAGKKPGDDIAFPLPPPGVKLVQDDRPSMAKVITVPNEHVSTAAAPRQQQVFPATSKTPSESFSQRHPVAQEVRVELPPGAAVGTKLVVQGSGGNKFEVTVPAGVNSGGSFLAMLPAEPVASQPTAAMSSAPAQTTLLAGGKASLSDAVADAVTSAVQDAVQQAAAQAATEEAAAAAAAAAAAPPEPAPAEAAAASAAPPEPAPAKAAVVAAAPAQAAAPVEAPAVVASARRPAKSTAPVSQTVTEPAPAAPQVQAVPPSQEEATGMGHRDAEQAYIKGEPIAAQEVPDTYEGEAVMNPDFSTNQYMVTIYQPVPNDGRRIRGIANTWNENDEVLSVLS
jgi:hypothetical protein